ncbi:MAG TPA: hypothetical protein DCL41_06905 [Bdellovibrionales bacterium]|nr:hypothetical protein [Bdellovibrionales bacterium]
MKNLKLLPIVFATLTLMACAGNEQMPEQMASQDQTEQDINQPVPPPEDLPPEVIIGDDNPPPEADQPYHFPQWNSNSGISQSMFERVRDYYNANWESFANRQYVVIIDLGKKSDVKRFVLFDLRTGNFTRYLTSHGKGSDPNNDGYLDSFSNVSGSKQSSIGYYKTLGTYYGSNGYSLRLDGLSETNSNALCRAIVVHGASYVNEAAGYAGRSWGCPALDQGVSASVINKIKGGALFVVATSREVNAYFKLARK